MSSTVEPMSCDFALDLIDPMLDDELDASVAEDLHRHLDACPSCSGEAAAAPATSSAEPSDYSYGHLTIIPFHYNFRILDLL